MPAFWSTMTAPNPTAPAATTRPVQAARSPCRPASASSGAAAAKRATVSQAGPSHSSDSFESGTVRPQSAPAAASARMAVRFVVPMRAMLEHFRRHAGANLTDHRRDRIIFGVIALSLDSIDLRLLEELQSDADRANVEFARLVGLSPAATLHRVRRLKESGIVRGIAAQLDPAAAGFPLKVYVAVTLERHDERAHRRFAEAVRAMPEVISADWVTGETDALLHVLAREVAELQRVLVRLSTRGGASRVTTLLHLEELKPASPLPLEPA